MSSVPEASGVSSSEAVTVLGHEPDAIEELAHSRRGTVTASVHRVRAQSATAVVKVVTSAADQTANERARPADSGYWLREPVLYELGLPRPYRDAGIESPDLLARFARPNAVALWLEDLQGLPGSSWSGANYGATARRLGRAQGPYLVGVAQPGELPWSRGFLATYLATWEDVGWDRIHDAGAWETELIRSHFSPQLRDALLGLCAQRRTLIGWAELLPQTISHHDVWVNNAFDFGNHTTLIDWAFAGHGHVGADVGNLVSDSCGDLLHPTASLPDFDASATAGYREGLRDAGWLGDFRLARLGMCLMAAKWSWLVPWSLRGRADRA